MNEADKRELANFLDTEGYIGITVCSTPKRRRHPRFTPMMILANTERSWLESVKGKWGGTIYPQKNENPTHKAAWQWHIHGEKLLFTLDAVRPYLKIKREQCDLCRELQYRISHRVGIDLHRRLTPAERDFRTGLYRKCKLLTATGPKAEQLPLVEPKPQLTLF